MKGVIGLRLGLLVGGTTSGRVKVEVQDLTPKFIAFYEAATAQKADPEARWQLWKTM